MYEPIKRTPSYSTRPQVEYQYFRQIHTLVLDYTILCLKSLSLLSSTLLGSQTFSIRFDDESRVGTPLRQYLIVIDGLTIVSFLFQLWMHTVLRVVKDVDQALVVCRTPVWECLVVQLPSCELLMSITLTLIPDIFDCQQIR